VVWWIASIVVIAELPTLSTGVWQARAGPPSMWTVQAPHCAMPHPYLVPVIPSASRMTQSSGVSPSTSTLRRSPLIFRSYAMNSSLQLIWLLGDDEVQVLAQHPEQGISGSESIATSSAVRPRPAPIIR
jgi:hypothetical protein